MDSRVVGTEFPWLMWQLGNAMTIQDHSGGKTTITALTAAHRAAIATVLPVAWIAF